MGSRDSKTAQSTCPNPSVSDGPGHCDRGERGQALRGLGGGAKENTTRQKEMGVDQYSSPKMTMGNIFHVGNIIFFGGLPSLSTHVKDRA